MKFQERKDNSKPKENKFKCSSCNYNNSYNYGNYNSYK